MVLEPADCAVTHAETYTHVTYTPIGDLQVEIEVCEHTTEPLGRLCSARRSRGRLRLAGQGDTPVRAGASSGLAELNENGRRTFWTVEVSLESELRPALTIGDLLIPACA